MPACWRMIVARVAEAKAAAARLYRERGRYLRVEKATGVPWRFIAVLHHRESGGDFAGVLHNGEHIIGTGRRTRLVPAGRGPFPTWEAAAIDALTLKGLHLVREWPREAICFHAEAFNGWGYRNRGVASAYLWAGSSNYVSGKYVADHVWDAGAVDRQLGCMVVFDCLARLVESGAVESNSGEAAPPAEPLPPFPDPPDVPPIDAPPARPFLSILFDLLRAIFKRG